MNEEYVRLSTHLYCWLEDSQSNGDESLRIHRIRSWGKLQCWQQDNDALVMHELIFRAGTVN